MTLTCFIYGHNWTEWKPVEDGTTVYGYVQRICLTDGCHAQALIESGYSGPRFTPTIL